MPAPALLFALALMASDTPDAPPPPTGEPLPAGAPTQDYPLTAWCYGAMSEYLDIYQRVKPDLRAIDKVWGSSVPNEKEPYAQDMAAARDELKVLAAAVEAAEKASPTPIAQQGVQAIHLGRSVWAPAEGKTNRELARAWLSWALPDRCDSTARSLAARSALLGQALKYNSGDTAPDAAPAPSAPATSPPPTEAPPAAPAPTPAAAAALPPIGQSAPSAAVGPAASDATMGASQPAAAPASAPASASAPTVDSLLSGQPPQPAPVDSGAQAPPEIAPAKPPTVPPPSQPDPNGPIPDPTPQSSAPNA